jgi:hypothetical protein
MTGAVSNTIGPDFVGAGTRDVVWCWASKGVIPVPARAGLPLAHVTDINPCRQGRYLGGTGFSGESSEDVLRRLGSDARILIMNLNYAGEITAMAGDRFTLVEV